jgi:hypothetical protein
MRFDRRPVPGSPDAGFIGDGADIDVVTLTGSVMPSIEQKYSTYSLTQQQVIGYPRGWEDMFEASNHIYNSGVTLTWGHGFDIGGFNSFASNFVVNGGGAGIDSWNFTAFTTDGYWYNPSLYVDMGGTWQALTQWKGVPTFITASSIESSIGPRSNMDLGTVPAISGSSADVDYALRLMTTSSFLYTRVPNFYAGGYGRSTVTVFKYADPTASFDIHSYGRPGDEPTSACLSVVTGSTLRWAATSSAGFAELTVPVKPDTWYISLHLNSNLASGPRVWLGVVPFWGGEPPRMTAWESFIHLNQAQTGAYIGDCHFFGASSALHIAALYMGSTGIAGIGEQIGPEFTGALVDLQASLSARARTKFQSTNAIENSLTAFGTDLERRYLDQKLLGLGTGALGRSLGVTTITTGSIPSWTNSHIRNSAFVATVLSSSNHESQVLNAFRSGSEAIEQTSVPASASMYYSKKSTLNKIIAKKTASFFDTVVRDTNPGVTREGEMVPVSFTTGLGTYLNVGTGSQFGGGIQSETAFNYPAHIYIDVPVSGKLIDIAVWLELHHVSSSQTPMPLGSLAVALSCPNINPGQAHPMYSLPGIRDAGFDVVRLWNNTFLLWEGLGGIVQDQRPYVADGTYIPNSTFREKYPGWDRDLSMRTIFHDGAGVDNPRHNLGLSGFVHGSGNYNGSPNAKLGINSAWGMGIYWTGSFGSPPAGWLSGPGNTAAVNEWPTSGSSSGSNYIKPLYPLLDSVEVVLPPQGPGVTYPTSYFGRPIDVSNGAVGTRKGLRGVEISGTWKLIFAYGVGDDVAMDLYFRQARLEITYESHDGLSFNRATSPINAQRFGRSGETLWDISGVLLGFPSITASNAIHAIVPSEAEIGRTFGIGLLTGAINQSNYALIYRLTGTLADISGTAPGWLLNNEFGMPRMPLSSASLVETEAEPIVSIHPQDILTIRPLLDGAQRLSDAARDAKPTQTRAEYAVEVNEEDDE